MRSRQIVPLPLALGGASGGAALIYTLVWTQLLESSVGASEALFPALLAGGACLGSLLVSRIAPARIHPLRLYAGLEIASGVLGLLALIALPLIGTWSVRSTGAALNILAIGTAGLLVLLPTFCLGATLPTMSRWLDPNTDSRGLLRVGLFHGCFLAGAVLGGVLAGFYLMPVYDLATASHVALALTVLVALVSFRVASDTPEESPGRADSQTTAQRQPAIYVACILSGMTAMAGAVVWTRLLALVLGGTAYTFSVIMVALLSGLAIGAGIGALMSRYVRYPRLAFGWCLLLLCPAITWTSWLVTQSLPFWPIDLRIGATPFVLFQLDFVRCAATIFPAAILWGASFPLALAAVAADRRETGRLVGRVYAAHLAGAAAGALVASLMIVLAGSQVAQKILIASSALAALMVLAPTFIGEQRPFFERRALVIALAAGVAWLMVGVPPVMPDVAANGRTTVRGTGEVLYVGEGLHSWVAVSRLEDGTVRYHNAGVVQSSNDVRDLAFARILGHLSTLVPTTPRSVLLIGYGTGVTAGAIAMDPRVAHLTVVEKESLVPALASSHFSQANSHVANNPKVDVRIDDVRHYLMTRPDTFDAIVFGPVDPWMKGTALLFTDEFLRVVRQHLAPGGVVTMSVPLHQTSMDAVKSHVATFFETFPDALVFGNAKEGNGEHDLVLLGQAEGTPIDVEAMQQRLDLPEYANVAQSLREAARPYAAELLATYAGRAADLKEWLKDAVINRDGNLRLQFLAGLGPNFSQGFDIYWEILTHRKYPEDRFMASADTEKEIRQSIVRGYFEDDR